jgi:hypothetical protein
MPSTSDFTNHMNSLSGNALLVWREAQTHLRALSLDIWDGVKFFIAANAALLGGIITLFETRPASIAIPGLAVLGLTVALVALGIFSKQRLYYVQMLARTLLFDRELGFRGHKVGTLDLSFPWGTYKASTELLEKDSETWIQNELNRKSSVRWRLLLMYYLVLILHAIILLVAIASNCSCVTHLAN